MPLKPASHHPLHLLLALFFLLPLSAMATNLNVYGFVPGHSTPQTLSLSQIKDLKTTTHEKMKTWLALVTELDTPHPKLHVIDTDHFKKFPTEYGIHQAYAEQMGLVSGASDFISRLKGDGGRERSIMPFTFYIPNSSLDKNGLKAHWVLQNRRYNFKDSSRSFVSSLVRSQALFQSNLGDLIYGKPFFITYEKANSSRRPNLLTKQGLSDISTLRQNGFEVVTESEMSMLSGQKPSILKIHNSNGSNEAFGHLKLVESEADLEDLTPRHIAIFSSLPDRIPPVAAIVTLESQTELSHINVLAINRGTLNVAVSESATRLIDEIKNRIAELGDEPVQLKVFEEALSLSLTTESKVVEFQKKVKEKIGVVDIPQPLLSGDLGVRKASPMDSPSTIGAKAANYGKMERLLGEGLVRPGYAIGFDLYHSIVTAGGQLSIQETLILPLIQKLRSGEFTPRQVNLELTKIREAINQASLPKETLLALTELANSGYRDLGDNEKIRLRSSTNCEDLPRFNGAGLYLSEGIKIKHLRAALSSAPSERKLHEDLLLVVGSIWLPRAFWEREFFSIDHLKVGMAIQINPSFTDEAANGVLVASKKGLKMNYWINSQFGEASVTNPSPGEVPESIKLETIATQSDDLLLDLRNNLTVLHSPSNLQSIFWSSAEGIDPEKEPALLELLLSSQKVFHHFIDDPETYGIDIEFKLMNEQAGPKIYLKQARPIYLGLSH